MTPERFGRGHDRVVSRVVLDPGPIPLAEIERFDDPDVDTALEHDSIDPDSAAFRLVEISVWDLQDAEWLQRRPEERAAHMVESLRRGVSLPPIVTVQTARDGVFGLLDGVNRAHAHWLLRRPTIRAYELIGDSPAVGRS
jgi:hypothetical protein